MNRKYRVIINNKYSLIYKPHFKYSNHSGRILEHRYIYHIYLSIKYNRVIYLPKKYDVHHINKNTLDNRIENLELLNKSDHKFKDSKNKNRICNICKTDISKGWLKDINGFLCLVCHIMLLYYKKKFDII